MYHRYMAWRNPGLRNYFPFVREAMPPAWEEQKHGLRRLAIRSAQTAETLGNDFPVPARLRTSLRIWICHYQLDQFWRELGVPHLDLLPVFKDASPKDLTVNAYDAHPNETANRLAAAAVEQFLQRQ